MLLNFTQVSSQPVVLFLHGFLGNHTEFHSVMSRLEQFNCITIDLPGHGKTQEFWEYSVPNTAAAIVDLLTQAQIDQVNLVGYSMGGRLALYLALNYPDQFPKAVIESGSPGLKTAEERSQRIQHDQKLAARLEADFPQFLRDWYNMPLFQSFAAHPNFEQIVQERAKNNPLELARSLKEMGTGMQPSLWKTLESHRQPILLIVGAYDRKFIEINQEMAMLCPTAELAIVSDCGHNVHWEKPEEFVDRLQRFL
jgi:2-succinyl-6-hydroxy-2,4-cyclohexadiene-1-carboxylate synthase